MLSLPHAQLQSNQDSSDWDDKLLRKISKKNQYCFIKKIHMMRVAFIQLGVEPNVLIAYFENMAKKNCRQIR